MKDTLRLGFADAIITPKYPEYTYLDGYGFRLSPATDGVRDDLHAKGCSKIAAARRLQKQLGRKILVCMGDAENDVILSALQLEEKTLEELIDITGLSAQELSMQLTLLELNGRVERRAGRAYALVR